MPHLVDERHVLLEDCVEVETVDVVDVEVVPLVTPGLAEDLLPLGGRVDLRFELRRLDLAVARLRLALGTNDCPAPRGRAVEQLLPVGRNARPGHACEERLCLALLERVALEREPALAVLTRLREEERAVTCAEQADVRSTGDAQRESTLLEPGEIDDDLLLVLLLVLLALVVLLAVVSLLALLALLLLGVVLAVVALVGLHLLVVALGEERRGRVLAQDGEIDGAVHRVVVGAHVEPADVRPVVRAPEEVEVLSALVPGRRTAVGQAVGDLLDLLALERVHEDRRVLIGETAGVGDEAAIR